MDFIHRVRGWVMPIILVSALIFVALGFGVNWGFYWGAGGMGLLFLVGVYDRFQNKHSILRNYPVLGHLRFLMESAGPEMHQVLPERLLKGSSMIPKYL